MEIDRNFVIFDCKPNGSDLFFGGAIVLSQTLGDSLAFGNIDFERNYKGIHSMLNNRMWMVHDKVNCARLTYGCNKIGKPPPTPTSVIDTSLFTSSKTKLGRAAVMFGLGNGPNGYESNLSAILACTEIMSKLDVPMETLNDTVHPMIYYLMQYNDQMNDEVRARYFNEAEYPSLNKIDDIPIMMLVDDVLTTRKAEFKKLYSERQKQKEDDDDDDDDDFVGGGKAVVKPKELYSERQKQKDDDDDDDDDDNHNHFVVGGKAVVKPKKLYIAGLKYLKTGSMLRPVYHDYNNILSRNDDDDDDDDDDVDDDVVDDDDDDDFVGGGKAVVKPKELYSERQKQKDDDDDDDDDNHNHFVVGGKAVVKPKELYIAGLKYLKTGSMLRPVYHDYNNILSRKDDDDDEDSDNDQDQDMMNDDD